MANRFPLVIDTTDGNKLAELSAGDNLDLRENSIVRVQDVTALGTINAADIRVNGNRLEAQTFIDLTDTPDNFVDAANKFVKVNSTGDALEFRPFSDIGNIEVEEIEVSTRIVPDAAGTVNIGTDDLYFDRVVANEFKGDLIAGNDSRVFNAATGKISYAALEGAPTNVSEFTNDIGYMLTEDLDTTLAALFDEGEVFSTDIKGSVFGDDSSVIIDGVASEVIGVINNNTITTVNLTATNSTATTSTANTFRGTDSADVAIEAQGDYNVNIGQNNTGKTVIFNGEADDFGFEGGTGIAEFSAASDLIFRAGNRIKFADTVVRLSQFTGTDAGYIVGQNGDVIYNTTTNKVEFFEDGDWVALNSGSFEGNISVSTGQSDFNDVVIAGDLTVSGTTTTVDTENTTISDNVIVLNNGETGAGVTDTTSGIEIDRGTETNVTFVWDDSSDKWTLGTQTLVAATFEGALTGNVTGNLSGDVTSTGTSSLATVTISGNTTATGTVTSSGGFIGNVTGAVTGDVVGSVFADNSSVLVDATNGTIPAANLTGSATIDVTGSLIGNVTCDVTGDVTGNVDGNVTGDVQGSVFGDDSTVIVDAVNNTLNGNLTGNVTGNIDQATLTVGATSATAITLGNSGATTTVAGTVDLTSAIFEGNFTADDSITFRTQGNTANEAISIGPQGTGNTINLTASNIRFFGPITTNLNAQGGVTGDLKGSVVSDDSTVIIDGVSGTVFKANVEDSANWDTAYSWGDHSTAGYIQNGESFTGDVSGSIFSDDSSIMVNAVDFTMFTDVMNLTPLNAEPTPAVNGMLVAADGTSWDPASKSGSVSYPVYYDGTAWNALY